MKPSILIPFVGQHNDVHDLFEMPHKECPFLKEWKHYGMEVLEPKALGSSTSPTRPWHKADSKIGRSSAELLKHGLNQAA